MELEITKPFTIWTCSLFCKTFKIWPTICAWIRYLAHGTATDYMYDVVRVPMAFTFEVREMQSLSLLLSIAALLHMMVPCLLCIPCRFMEMEQRLRRTASKCLTPLTSPPSMYVILLVKKKTSLLPGKKYDNCFIITH